MPSPPKPWERSQRPAVSANASSTPPVRATSSSSPSSLLATANASSSSANPQVPAQPAPRDTSVNQNTAAYSRPLGASPYGSYGGAYSSPYGSPYSRMGGYGGYGSYGGYGGGMYGGGGMGYGGGMYGGGMGGGMYGGIPGGMPGDPNNPDSLTNRFNMGTQATFQMLEGIVAAFGGFAQMLESTYMATHSSFFAMVAVAEQFGNLRNTLGSVLGIFTLMRWLRTLLAKITGRPPPADAMALTPAAFARFEGRVAPSVPDGVPPKPSRKPLFFFLLAAFGLPYVMGKMIRSLAASARADERRREAQALAPHLGNGPPADPSQLEFCRLLYDFHPDASVQGGDLDLKQGDLVAVLSKTEPTGAPSEWWRCRARNGQVGYLPANILHVLRKPSSQPIAVINAAVVAAAAAGDATRANSLTSTVSAPGVLKRQENDALPKTTVPSAKAGDVKEKVIPKSQLDP